jgi:hypothetical protein
VDLIDEADDHGGGILVEIEVLDELLEKLHARQIGLGEREAALRLGRTHAVGGDEGAEPGDREAADAGNDLGLGVDARRCGGHGRTPFRGS